MLNTTFPIASLHGTGNSTPTSPPPCCLPNTASNTQTQWQKQLVLLLILVITQVAVAFAVREIYRWLLRRQKCRQGHQPFEERGLHSSGAAGPTDGAIGLVQIVADSVV